MFDKIIAFFMSIIAFFSSLFGMDQGAKIKEFNNLSYGTHERQILDFAFPAEAEGEVGLVLMIHGGGWIQGDKNTYKSNVKSIPKNYGYAAAAINYRYISETVHMTDLLDDIDAALKKIKSTAAENGVSINKVLLTGTSAGGHLSLLYAYSRAETAPIKPAAVVSNCGPTNFTDESFYINNAMGDEEFISNLFSLACGQSFTYAERASAKEALLKISPISYVNENTVPTVINHGDKDTFVPYSNAIALDLLLTQYGVKHDFNTYKNSDHDLAGDKDASARASELINQYAAAYLK